DRDLVADGERLAGEDEVRGHLGVFEGVVANHVDLAAADLRATGPAHSALAGERHVRARFLRGIEDGLALRHRRGGPAPVEYDRDLAGGALDDLVRVDDLRRGFVDVEEFEVDLLLRHVEFGLDRPSVTAPSDWPGQPQMDVDFSPAN